MTSVDDLQTLKKHLQQATSSQLENLAAGLIGSLLDLPIAVATSGFQHGADAGPAGQQGRRFRLECKAYSDLTSLSERELLGEIDQAILRDESLEAWLLVATRTVSEQLRQSLHQKGDGCGVPVVIIDWVEDGIGPLAALCAVDADLVAANLSPEAGMVATALQAVSHDTTQRLRRDLQSWCLGFESVRSRSHEHLTRIWTSPREANAAFGQDVAGGAQENRVRRSAVHHALSDWWHRPPNADAPAAVVGLDGVGKTWATLDWLLDTRTQQPVVLAIPASATDGLERESSTRLKQLLADSLHELVGVRDREHWLHRVDRLLARPIGEGPVFTVFFDGLNQNTSVDWRRRLKILQSRAFSGRVRAIVSSRNHYFHTKLAGLRSLTVPPSRIHVGIYDDDELERLLNFDGLSQADLHPGVLQLAHTPRLFKLVVRFRERLVHAGQVTVHRLLWEYGRDTLGERAENSFDPDEWLQWLREMAITCRDGIHAFSVRSLSETVDRPDLTKNEVYARLSDIIDGRIATPNTIGDFELNPLLVAHALGVALLNHLDQVVAPTYSSLELKLSEWLDPISGLDQRSEILRAALSILIEQGKARDSVLSAVLLASWLQSQNVPDNHLREIVALAPNLVSALLEVVEHSDAPVYNSARLRAIHALRELPRNDGPALDQVVAHCSRWLRVVSRGLDPNHNSDPDQQRQRARRLTQRVGRDSSGPITVLGIDLELVDYSTSLLPDSVPLLLDGFPLARALQVFEIAAVSMAIADTNGAWRGLRWICLLNEEDPLAMTRALRGLSKEIRSRNPEPGVLPDLAHRVAALLLWLTAEDTDDEAACAIDPDYHCVWTYEKDYLRQPDTSMLPLERRHAERTLNNTDLRWVYRIQRLGELWLDPHFAPPDSFVSELTDQASRIDVSKLHRSSIRTIQDREFAETIAPALARCNPPLLASLLRRKLQSMATCPPESRFWSAIHATDHLILARHAEATAARSLRLSTSDSEANSEDIVVDELLKMEVSACAPRQQVAALVEADVNFVSLDFTAVLGSLSPDDVDALVTTYGTSDGGKRRHNLLLALSLRAVRLTDRSWKWIYETAKDSENRGLAFKILADSDPKRFGRALHADNWSWEGREDIWVNHYGTGALIEATADVPFDQVASRIAPWRLIEGARRRGSDRSEVRLAATLLGRVLVGCGNSVADPGCDLSVERSERNKTPFAYSVSPRQHRDDAISPLTIDADSQVKAHEHAFDAAEAHIRETRVAGASLYIVDVEAKDFEVLLIHAPEMIEDWLTGYCEPTDEFRRRVHLAEGAFLGLCEALLTHDPARGIRLWRTLRSTMMTTFIGECDVEDLLHMVFRVPDSAEVLALRAELLDLKYCHTDRGLFELALAATYNGRTDWLTIVIGADQSCPVRWRRIRGAILCRYTVHNELPVAGAWPEGEISTRAGGLEVKSARGKWLEACARHWWRVYLCSADPIEAYAAWVLFLRATDMRVRVWMSEDAKSLDHAQDLSRLKLAHSRLNRADLKRAYEKRNSKLERVFLDRPVVAGLGPWAEP